MGAQRTTTIGRAAVAAFALGSAFAVAACGGGEAAAEDTTAAAVAAEASPKRVINVEVVTVEPAAFAEFVRMTGVARADRDVTVAAEEAGVVRRVFVDKGERVEAGQPIAKIDDEVLRAQADQAAAAARLAEETWQRQKRLWEQDKIGSEMTYLQAKYGAEQAAAQAKMLAARLERTVVRAPVGGLLDRRMVEVGSMVSPGAPVARILDIEPIKVEAGVPERFAGELARGARARLTFDALGGHALDGAVSFVGAALDDQNRTVPIEVAVPNPGGRIRPGLVANVALELAGRDSALAVPQQAVLRSADGYLVYVAVDEGGRTIAEARSVTTGAREGGRVLVESGLRAGDRVVVVGQQRVAAGDVLKIVEPDAGGAR